MNTKVKQKHTYGLEITIIIWMCPFLSFVSANDNYEVKYK
jgi:hypothetical protein